MPSSSFEWLLSLVISFMVLSFDDFHVLVEPEDGASEEERLGNVVEQSAGDVVDADHLICHQCYAAHDEQHGTGILRDFEVLVFHIIFFLNTNSSYYSNDDSERR